MDLGRYADNSYIVNYRFLDRKNPKIFNPSLIGVLGPLAQTGLSYGHPSIQDIFYARLYGPET